MGTKLLLLLAGCWAKKSVPLFTVAHHLLVMAFSPSCSGGQLVTACSHQMIPDSDPDSDETSFKMMQNVFFTHL